jgi:hypothetical protein
MQGLPSNQRIIGAHRRSGTFQLGADHACDAGVLISERQRLERCEKHGEALGVGFDTRAFAQSSNSAMEESPTCCLRLKTSFSRARTVLGLPLMMAMQALVSSR